MATARFHTLELLDRRWSPQVLIRLLDSPQCFVQLAAEIRGVSRRMLTERLREFEVGGVVTRRVESGPPISVTYALAQVLPATLDGDGGDTRREDAGASLVFIDDGVNVVKGALE